MIKRSYWIMVGGLMALLAAGCSPGESLGESAGVGADEAVPQERYGTLSVQYFYPRQGEDKGLKIQAQFLDIRGVATESALEALEVWHPRRGLALGTCETTGGRASAASTDELGSLHLLDVGRISVQSPRDQVALEPRRLPDLLSAFYGVVYSSEWGLEQAGAGVDYYPGAFYDFSADGTEQAGAFNVTMSAPEPMVLLAADGVELRDRADIQVKADAPLDLVWNHRYRPEGAAEVYIDISTGFGPDQRRLQCRVEDVGAFSIPSGELEGLSEFGAEFDLEIRRVHRDRLSIDGVDEVETYFATVDAVELRLD